MGRKSIQAIIALLVLAAGCSKEDAPAPNVPGGTSGRKAFVVCEGSLGNGNSSLGLYLPEKDSTFEDVFKAVNGQGLGDVFQSMTRIGNQYLLCINNSDKVLLINKDSWRVEGSIGVSKPRYIQRISDDKAYVSSLFSNRLHIINPAAKSLSGSITFPFKNPEGIFRSGNTAYIATWDTACNKVYTVDVATDHITDSITIAGRAAQEVLEDKEHNIWILGGNVYNGKQATLTRYDPVAKMILNSFTFPISADPIKPVFNSAGDTLYFIEVNYSGGNANNGVYRMRIDAGSLPAQPFIAAQNFQYFWALGIDPKTGFIYVGDPKGFTQRGSVTVYNQQGQAVKTFPTGIGSGHFFFDE